MLQFGRPGLGALDGQHRLIAFIRQSERQRNAWRMGRQRMENVFQRLENQALRENDLAGGRPFNQSFLMMRFKTELFGRFLNQPLQRQRRRRLGGRDSARAMNDPPDGVGRQMGALHAGAKAGVDLRADARPASAQFQIADHAGQGVVDVVRQTGRQALEQNFRPLGGTVLGRGRRHITQWMTHIFSFLAPRSGALARVNAVKKSGRTERVFAPILLGRESFRYKHNIELRIVKRRCGTAVYQAVSQIGREEAADRRRSKLDFDPVEDVLRQFNHRSAAIHGRALKTAKRLGLAPTMALH